jgi:transposase
MHRKKPPVIGIDVSMRTFNARVCGHDREYANGRRGWRKLLGDSPPEAVFAMEATGYYHFRLASFLHSKQRVVYVCNPLWVNRYVGSLGGKVHSDKHDPANIARYFDANGEGLRQWEPASQGLGRAKIILAVVANLTKQKVMCRNLRHAISYADASEGLLSVPDYFAEALAGQIKELVTELAAIAAKLWPKEYALLLSVPGIGALTASALLVSANGMRDFPGHKQLASYLGLVPSVKQSGISINGRGHIVKCGSSRLRGILRMGAMSAVSYNPSLGGFYRQLVARGKPGSLAYVAVMHRMVRIAFGVVRSGEPYRGFREPEASGPK